MNFRLNFLSQDSSLYLFYSENFSLKVNYDESIGEGETITPIAGKSIIPYNLHHREFYEKVFYLELLLSGILDNEDFGM